VEKQVLSLFVATSGGVDSAAVADVGRFERFLQFVETGYPGIVSISEKALDDSIRRKSRRPWTLLRSASRRRQ
jgi:hypothetical protein